jgi:hypothetical protein
MRVFKVYLEGESIFCFLLRCIQGFFNDGWQLADPSQTADLVEALKEDMNGEPIKTLHPRTIARKRRP